MFVPCPHCGFLVALIVSKGGPAQQCPRCKQPLVGDDAGKRSGTATETTPIVSDEPAAADDATPLAQPSAATPVPPPTATIARAPETPSTTPPTAAPVRAPQRARKRQAPSFVRIAVPTRPATGPHWPGRLAIAALTVLLGLQLLLAQRNDLAMSDRWRPVIGAACALLGCELPPWHEPTAYTMLARSVQPANTPGVLNVTASFRNDARWPQPWPALSLSLSDVRGQPVAQRTFMAAEYRGGGAPTADVLAPGQSANVQFDVAEPASKIVAFTFDFR